MSDPLVLALGGGLAFYLLSGMSTSLDAVGDGSNRLDKDLMKHRDPTRPPYVIIDGTNQLRHARVGHRVFQTTPYNYFVRTPEGDIYETSPIQWLDLTTSPT